MTTKPEFWTAYTKHENKPVSTIDVSDDDIFSDECKRLKALGYGCLNWRHATKEQIAKVKLTS